MLPEQLSADQTSLNQGINARNKNRGTELIENFMVAANGVMAARYGDKLPPEPD